MKITVYDPNGVPVLVEAVDAREYVRNSGYTMHPTANVEDDPTTTDEPDEDDNADSEEPTANPPRSRSRKK